MYKLTVTKQRENLDYEKQLTEYRQQQQRMYDGNQATYPARFIDERCLEVVLTDEEFAAMKKAVLEVM